MQQPSSNLFEGYKSVGHVTGPLPFIVRHGKDPQDTRIITIVGKTFHTYTTKLCLTEVSIPLEHDITSIVSDERYVYTASGRTVYQWGRGSKLIVNQLGDLHQADVRLMIKFDTNTLLAIDEDNVLFNWNLIDKSLLNVIPFDDGVFKITALCQPSKYKNKVLLGSSQGQLQLWNIKAEQCLFKFQGWESKVTCIIQSPIEDVVAIGLEDGHVYVHNLKYDESVLKIYQEYGAITAMSFRLDSQPYLVTASPIGHLMIWNLERKRLSAQIRHAHTEHISRCQFLRNESLMVTSGTDNTLKVWSMDMSDGCGTLQCQRAGHSEPPSHIKFYGPKGFNLLSAGLDSTVKMFHVFSERLNRNLGTARMNPKSKFKSKSTDEPSKMINKLPPITCFAAETAKEKQWDNIAALHKGSSLVSTWNYDKCCMGEHIITQPTFNKHEVFGSAICITGCGNFVVIGFSNGLIFKYNIQSGMFRQYYESPKLPDHKAHEGQITGVTVDGLDLVLISSGVDNHLKMWSFKDGRLLAEHNLSASIQKIELHRENNLIAIALENNTIEILDLETRALVRKFPTTSKILDMTFSPDSRWLIVALADKSIRTWDLNLGRMIDAFQLARACTSISISSTGEFLATAHEDTLGINIWCNFTLYCPTPLRPILSGDDGSDLANIPTLDMPFVRHDELVAPDGDEREPNEGDEDVPIVADDQMLVEPSYVSQNQLSAELITLSGLPSSRWKNLLNIEELRQKQLIEEDSKREKQVKVPFFIPVKDGLKPQLDSETIKALNVGDNKEDSSSIARSKISQLRLLSPLAQCLMECSSSGGGGGASSDSKNAADYRDFLMQLKDLGPSATDAEIRSLGKDTCGSIEPMLYFLDAIEQNLSSNIDYELTSSWLAVYLKAHSDVIQTNARLKERCRELLEPVGSKWDRLHAEFNQIFSVLNFVRSSIL